MDADKSFLVVPKRFGGGWRLNWKHRFAVRFAILQVCVSVLPLWSLVHFGASDTALGLGLFAVVALSGFLWFWLYRNEI